MMLDRLLRNQRVLRFILMIALISHIATVGTAEWLAPEVAARVDRSMQEEMNAQQAVGLAVGVIQNGEIVYLKGYGFADREQMIPVTRDTMFRWASVSKCLTAVAAMQLAEKNCLDIMADVRHYVPEFPDPMAVISSRDLLCHQSGVVHYSNGKVIGTECQYNCPHPFENVVLALNTFNRSPLLHPPEEKYSYTTHGYILLSAVVERAGRQKFAEQVATRIVQPLHLKTLQPDYQWLNIPHRAVGYAKHNNAIEKSTNTDVSWKLGGGGYISNIDDMAGFAAGLINRKLVSRDTYDRMWTPQKTSDGKLTEYGLGFQVMTENGRLKVGHSGSQEKTRTRMVIYPDQKSGVVVMTNSEYGLPEKFTTRVFTALKGD